MKKIFKAVYKGNGIPCQLDPRYSRVMLLKERGTLIWLDGKERDYCILTSIGMTDEETAEVDKHGNLPKVS